MILSNKAIKMIVLTLLILGLTVGFAAAATLTWSPSSGTVDGYKVHYGTSPGNPSGTVDVGDNTQYSLNTLSLSENAQYFFCISAYNTSGESDPCAPVAYTPADSTPPAPPVGLVVE